jgi:hypothetical protein
MMTDVAATLAGQAADATPGRDSIAPRWYRLNATTFGPGVLRLMAGFWRAVGSLVLNPIVVFLTKTIKRVQPYWRAARTVIALVAAGATGYRAYVTKRPAWVVAAVLVIGFVVVYVALWIRARMIQRREDR